MSQPQRIAVERRAYNQWVADQTLEDYALRFTAISARRGAFRIGNTALGAISFLACESIGGALSLAYGVPNVIVAVIAMAVTSFVLGLPIVYHAAKAGVDVDLLTRGAGFGYLGSTITSLIYASFTFVLFSIEASIMSVALDMVFGIPLWVAHIISSLIVIPFAAYGIRMISKMQLATQPIWLVLQLAPLIYIAIAGHNHLGDWLTFGGTMSAGTDSRSGGTLGLLAFGAAFSVLLSLLPQIAEQGDYLRFLPPKTRANRWKWWSALVVSGPGWVGIGGLKIVIGSFLTYLALRYGIAPDRASQPAELYNLAFLSLFHSPGLALALTGIFVVVCQIKINVTNAYAGSIAWSNFFSRLTHSHPGRVVWLVFNVLLALLLMEIGIFRVIENILGLYANFAVGWMGALVADLMVNKPLGLSPRGIEFKRAHLYDINPVGTGAMGLSVLVSSLCFFGLFGPVAQALCALIGLVVAFIAAPAIAWATGGRYYLARQSQVVPDAQGLVRCAVCENAFEPADMAHCTAYNAPICSLCCTLEARCRDLCKPGSRIADQAGAVADKVLPPRLVRLGASRLGRFLMTVVAFNAMIAAVLGLIRWNLGGGLPGPEAAVVSATLWIVFLSLFILSGIAAWLLVLAHESRRAAEGEFEKQAVTLMDEISAHERTDAALQKAKEVAESANFAKSRYIAGLSHEIRSPLNSIFGYAQLLERDAVPQAGRGHAVKVIRRSAEHLSDLVDGLLDISKIESGALVLNRDKVKLPDMLSQLADMFAIQAQAKGIAFDYDRAGWLPDYVHTDAKRLKQVLINLLSNAVKFTDTGGVTFRVRARSHVCTFEITDTGIGIPEGDLERIFKPFERGSSADARAMPGTGLGLTITKLLVEIMGGTLSVESRPGEGSTMTVRILLFAAEPPERASDARGPICGYAGAVRRILVVDDDPDHLGLMRHSLAPLGFVVTQAASPSEALRVMPGLVPDLAILDVNMPGMSGWDLAARLRETWPETRILMVSANAYDRPAVEGRAHDRAYHAFLAKPFTQDRLLTLLGEILGLDWIHAAEAAPVAPAISSPALSHPVPSSPVVSARAVPASASSPTVQDLPETAPRVLEEIGNLADIGYIRGLREKLAQIEAEDPRYGPLAAQLGERLALFDMEGIAALVRRMQ